MLPYSSLDFYLFIFGAVAYIATSKYWIGKWLSYSNNLMIISLLYLLFYYPQPWHIILLVVYSYLLYYLLSFIIKLNNKLVGAVLLLLPMLLVKSDIRFHFYPFELNDILSFAGLSYISFRILSVYMDVVPGSKPVNFFQYTSYLIFTPTLLIGPIDRYSRFVKDTEQGYTRINWANMIDGCQLFAYGVLYKYVFAEAIDRYWLGLIDHSSTGVLDMANSMYAYMLYLFFDFAGYSAMAIGIGKMMGIDVPINFNKPFLSRNPPDFWRRFHKSLGDWLNDYFFKPLYMYFTRKKKLKPYPLMRQNTALFATFTLMGCWNGFHINFILSGMIFGLYSAGYNTYMYHCRKRGRDIVFGELNEETVKWISIFIMVNLAAFAVYIFSGRCPLI